MNELNAYDDALSYNIATLQRLLASHQYEEALACMDERLAIITALTDFSRQQKTASAEMATLVRDQLGKVRTSIPRTKNENFSHLISMGYQ